MGAEKVELEVLGKVLGRVLDPPYLGRLLEQIGRSLHKGPEDLDFEIASTERARWEGELNAIDKGLKEMVGREFVLRRGLQTSLLLCLR